MPLFTDPNAPLPQFRTDLRLYKGPVDADGFPTFNLYEPVKEKYYKINWWQSHILKSLRPKMTLSELCKEINSTTTAPITFAEAGTFFEDAFRYDLLEIQKSTSQIIKESDQSKVGHLKLLFYKYLYFRVPLLKPDAFLKKTLPFVLPLASRAAFCIYFLITFVGVMGLIDKFPEFVNTFAYFFNFNGLIISLIGILAFKFIHEFAHAYTACYYHVRVPSMGVAFILLVPVLYTDTTDAWKLPKRNDRIMISAAGLISELVLAGLCTLGWVISSPGPFKSIFFVISSVLWISSILINMNPAMRYDGYYLLSDWIEIDNLQSRAFNLTRWWAYYLFFGINIPYPEENLSKKMTVFLIIYSIFTWVYRLFFYFGLAILIYIFNADAKFVAIAMFIGIMFALVVNPIASEITEIVKLKRHKALGVNTIISIALFLLLPLIFLSPLPKTLKLDAVAVPTFEQNIYAPENSKIKAIYVQRGESVEKGKLLMEFSSESLEKEIKTLEISKKILEKEVNQYVITSNESHLMRETLIELESVKSQLAKLLEKKENLKIHSTISGIFNFSDENLKQGQYVYKSMLLGAVEYLTFKVIAFIPENQLSDIHVNQKAKFVSKRSFQTYEGRVSLIDPVRETYLEYPALASSNSGNLLTSIRENEPESKRLELIDSVYRAEIELDNPREPLLSREEGKVKISGVWKSNLDSVVDSLKALFWKESGI